MDNFFRRYFFLFWLLSGFLVFAFVGSFCTYEYYILFVFLCVLIWVYQFGLNAIYSMFVSWVCDRMLPLFNIYEFLRFLFILKSVGAVMFYAVLTFGVVVFSFFSSYVQCLRFVSQSLFELNFLSMSSSVALFNVFLKGIYKRFLVNLVLADLLKRHLFYAFTNGTFRFKENFFICN